ncbi:MAG: rod shape-determining protein RodA [Treponemataceae bacterium]|nr:MAG: rod shape-determining protein RodA [Treponemataceae bacterium]
MRKNIFDNFDYFLLLAVIILIGIGIIFIYSSGINSAGINVSNEYKKQILFAICGLAIMAFMIFFDYRLISRNAYTIYGILLVVLIYTCIFGTKVKGARSWIGVGDFGVQPSEFGKLIFIMTLAKYLEYSTQYADFKRFVTASLIMFVPVVLTLLQPDFGTAMVYFPIFFIMCFFAGINKKYLMGIIIAVVLTGLFTILPIWETEIVHKSFVPLQILHKFQIRLFVIVVLLMLTVLGFIGFVQFKNKPYFYTIFYFSFITSFSLILSYLAGRVLKDYQLKRLIVFLDPNTDPLGAGWNIIQSKIAIGAGGLFGQGLLKGTQSHYRFLPEQSTDFIFSILAEEWGLFGCLIVFALYCVIFVKILNTIKNTSSAFYSHIAAGIFGMFAFHFFLNIGMVMGIMPITGIPLLFLSYGGSSLWTAMICTGLIIGINNKKFE